MNTLQANDLMVELINSPEAERLAILKTRLSSFDVAAIDCLLILNEVFVEKIESLKLQQEQHSNLTINICRSEEFFKSWQEWETALIPVFNQLVLEQTML